MQIAAQHSQENLQSQRMGAQSSVGAATGPEAEVRTTVDAWQQALRDRDVAKVLSFYADDIVAYDLMPPLARKGLEPSRASLERWYQSFEEAEPVHWELRDLAVSAGESVAHCNGLALVGTPKKAAGQSAMWMRWSSGLRKTGGVWKFVFEHFSVPFDMENRQALTSLEP